MWPADCRVFIVGQSTPWILSSNYLDSENWPRPLLRIAGNSTNRHNLISRMTWMSINTAVITLNFERKKKKKKEIFIYGRRVYKYWRSLTFSWEANFMLILIGLILLVILGKVRVLHLASGEKKVIADGNHVFLCSPQPLSPVLYLHLKHLICLKPAYSSERNKCIIGL